MTTAFNLSPQILSLGDDLITKLTGFSEAEENFGICHDFLVSNLLYHTYLEPHERDVRKRFEKLVDKWQIQSKGEKATRFEQLLEQYFSLPVFEDEHEQHGLRARLLVLLLSLSNSDKVKAEDEDEGSDDVQLLIEDIVTESEFAKAARKAQEIRKMLAEGEEPCVDFSSCYSDLSDWSDDDEESFAFREIPSLVRQLNKSVASTPPKKKTVITHLPGVSMPLQPPQCMPEFEGNAIEVSVLEARKWLAENLMPPYWSEETDSKALAPIIEVTNPMPDAQFVKIIDTDLFERGLPVGEKLVLPEYQVLYECIWTLEILYVKSLLCLNGTQVWENSKPILKCAFQV